MGYSRLASHERALLTRQTIFFGGAGIAIIIAYVFIVLPIFSKVLVLTNKQALPEATQNAIVMSPTLIQPYTATNSAEISLRGTSQPGYTIILGQNGSLDKQVKADDKGEFIFESVSLSNGDNLFQAYAETNEGDRSDGSPPMHIQYVTDAPKLDISEPADNATITQRKQQVIQVKGTTNPGNKVFLNDQFLFVSTDGSFTGSFQLQPGSNTLTIKAVNPASSEAIKELHVTYSP